MPRSRSLENYLPWVFHRDHIVDAIITCMKRPSLSTYLFSLILYSSTLAAQDKATSLWKRLEHEPIYFGYTFDSNDENYIDINLSLKWSPHDDGIHPELRTALFDPDNPPDYDCSWHWFDFGCLYLAFTTRQAFYFGTRDSSPVIGQRFNPEVFLRFWLPNRSYLDIGFNHESNGQSIDSREEFEAKQSELANGEGEGPSAAKEYISRNWNFWEISYTSRDDLTVLGNPAYAIQLSGRYFINRGEETSFEFEGNTNRIERAEVDGLRFTARRHGNCGDERHCINRKLLYRYVTGYKNALERDSHRLEWGFSVDKWPITLWAHMGYNEDLIDFYRYVKSIGISFEINDTES